MFIDVIVPACREKNIFGIRPTSCIPIEFKILISLRILGRGNCQDDMFELSKVKESTVGRIFKQFVVNYAAAFFDEIVYFPSGEELQNVMEQYCRMGCPLAVGSMDVTHVELKKKM